MTLYQVIRALESIALKQPNVGTAGDGNIYEYMNANPAIRYSVFFATQGTHTEDEDEDHYNLTLFYVDRLMSDMETNRLQIQSTGKEMLSNIIRTFCDAYDADCGTISYTPFTQRFLDETAGVYATITIDVMKDIICEEEF